MKKSETSTSYLEAKLERIQERVHGKLSTQGGLSNSVNEQQQVFNKLILDPNAANAESAKQIQQRNEIQFYGIQVCHPSQLKDKVVLQVDKITRQETIVAHNTMVDLDERNYDRLKWLNKLTFSPDARPKQVFNFFAMTLAIYSTFSATYIAAFGFPTKKSYVVLTNLVDLVFWIEIVLNFFQQYKDEVEYKPVKDVRMISYRYLKTNFIVDLIATIPFRYLKLTKNHMILDLFQLLKLLRLKKLLAHLSYRALQEVIKGIF